VGLSERDFDRGALAMTRALIAMLTFVAACGTEPRMHLIDDTDAEARVQYPDLSALYGSTEGIYRGCGPNGGVCHNGNEFPTLDSVGAIISNINLPCNQKRKHGGEIDDFCERQGDTVEIGSKKYELAYFEPYQDQRLVTWRMVLRDKPAMMAPSGEAMQVWRSVPDGNGGSVDIPFMPLGGSTAGYSIDAEDASGKSLLLQMPSDLQEAARVASFLEESSLPRPDRIHIGDPNRNHTFGSEIGGLLIKPGDPERSYLLRRMTDPTMGPLMPRANCCSWSKPSLRALWCWVDGLAPDGSNATAPIQYDTCRPSPPIELLYPEPGESCDPQNLCPVQFGGGTGDSTFPSIYAEILSAKCAGNGCHDTGDPGGVDFRSEAAALATLADRVVPGDPDKSQLWKKLDPTLCTGTCTTMPLGRAPLPDADLARLRSWIMAGAEPQ
jgi:hypothetical protein